MDIKAQLGLAALMQGTTTTAGEYEAMIAQRTQSTLADGSLNPAYKARFSHDQVREAEERGVKIPGYLQPFLSEITPNEKIKQHPSIEFKRIDKLIQPILPSFLKHKGL